MDPEGVAAGAAGLLLVFFLPGYAVTRAVFPERRIRGPLAGLRAVETVTASFVVSVALTILAGYALLELPSVGFAATWSDPVLEGVLVAITAAALLLGLARGAYAAEPPDGPAPEPAPGADDGGQLLARLETLDRARRRAAHDLRRAPDARAREAAAERLAAIEGEAEALRQRREAEYAS